MARISIRPIEPLELEFSDGTVKEALFNNEAFIIFTEEFGSIDKLLETEAKDKPYEFGAKVLYSGLKVIDKKVTLKESRSIIIGGGETLLQAILNSMINNFMLVSNEESKKKFIQELKKINKTMVN